MCIFFYPIYSIRTKFALIGYSFKFNITCLMFPFASYFATYMS